MLHSSRQPPNGETIHHRGRQSLDYQPGRRRPGLGKGPDRGRRRGGPARTAQPDTRPQSTRPHPGPQSLDAGPHG
eukprot:10688907-Alexandrium_andersonii.AAC.1